MIVMKRYYNTVFWRAKMFMRSGTQIPHPNKIELVTNETIYKHNINHGNVM